MVVAAAQGEGCFAPAGSQQLKVLVTGANGQLGRDVVEAYSDVDLVALGHGALDVAVESDVWGAITTHDPDLVIHAAAWTDVDGCETDPEKAYAINAAGTRWVAQACENVGATLVYVSTDYVFDGDAPRDIDGFPRGYTESDPIAPVNEYGRSKAAGEAAVRETLDRHHIVRTSWLCGARGKNFVRTMLRLGREQGRLRVVDDQRGSPTFTRDLVPAIRELAAGSEYGTVHRTNSGHCSWYEFAVAIFESAEVDVELEPIATEGFPTPAPRPAWSVLSNQKAGHLGLRPMREWKAGLERLLAGLGDVPS